ncbi:MAG: hypothetical protein CMO41_02585 [Verrucomicrobiales bacterium]|nr:hypothetical protein [Verrucomicrobiales bacterium]
MVVPDEKVRVRSSCAAAIAMTGLMLLVLAQPMVGSLGPFSTDVARSTYYTPQAGEEGVNTTSTGVLSIPYNRTFSGGQIDVTPMWSEAPDTSARFGIDANAGWNGTHQGTQGIGHGGQLSLATQSTLATLTDFETLIETLPDWVGQGPNHNAWNVVPLNASTAQQGEPINATHGQRVLATQGLGGLQANMSGCLASPAEVVPAFVNQYNLTVDHWLAFKDDDAAWMERRTAGGNWQVLVPTGGYGNSSSLSGAPASSWAGESDAWQQAHFSLDTVVQSSPTLEVRFCFQTSSTPGLRHGWFVDNYTLSNLGDVAGAWFHGNMSGDYANNADGRLYLPANLSGLTGPMKLEFWANWDLEGSFSDNLLVYVSVNNGTTWAPVSGIPGMPGNGFAYQGTYYTDESLGWVPISYNIPSGVSGHPNASNVLFQFQVTTNHHTGYGGFASSGWEGVAVDDVTVIHRPGTASEERRQLANFSMNSTNHVGDVHGWLDPSTAVINEWVWTTDFGMNPSSSTLRSFENSMTTPPGWTIEGTWPDGWEVGSTRNSSGWGPGVFHSGNNGAAINLTTKYTNNVYTHLISEEYTVPNNATARLSFRSWVCTEFNWDGGGVAISTDGGQQWWWLPPQLDGFHDQISTVNTNSPFFGRGIIDGSSVPNGCSASNQRDFELKTYDLSNLSGQSIKARFSFFSDTYVEGDGWYIDDAGVEIDVFESTGTWVSRSISPDPLFGYGWLDGWYEQPDGTTLLVDVLDAQHQPIEGHTNLTLPVPVAVDPVEHPTVHVRVRMATNDTYVTPLVHSLSVGRTTYIGPQHIVNSPAGDNAMVDSNGTLRVTGSFTLPLSSMATCPHDGYRLTTVGDNLTWLTTNGQLIASAHVPGREPTTYLNHSLGGRIGLMNDFTIAANGGEAFVRAKAEPDCVSPPERPHLALGWNNVSVMAWPPSGMSNHIGLNIHLSRAEHNGTNLTWSPSAPTPSIAMSNSTLELSYTTLEPPGAGNSGPPPAVVLSLNNQTSTTEVRINGVLQTLAEGQTALSHQSTASCPSSSNASLSPVFIALQRTCTLTVEVQGTADVKVLQFMHLLPDTTLQIRVSAGDLNTAKEASAGVDMRTMLDVPLKVQTDVGGLRVGLNATTLPLMTESVDAPAYTRWLPGQTVMFTTHHTRSNPLDLSENAPDITEVSFLLGPSSDANEAFIHVELDRIQTAPRFRQMDGAGLALFDASASSVVCTMNTCTIDWAFKSTWLLDDVDDLHVLTTATDDEGLAAGPEVFVRKTAFNEVENDLEVVEFTVTDSQQRRIDDWTNSFWPFHLDENETLLASGRVRMEGIANQWVEAGEAEATVTLRAVPPKNLSGGPDEWPGEPVSWSRSWTAEVESGGWFSVQTSTPTDEDGVPSNTFLELVPSLSRRGPVGLNASSSEDRTVVLTPTRLLFDTVQPTVNTLTVLDSGQEVPADGHVAMYGKDIALRLQISDPEGLASLLEVWTWLEKLHDTNNNGLMEADEYRMETVSLNRGVAELEVDLPLLSSESVVPDGANAGRLSIVLVGEDLAGNTLVGGGTFGEANDLATLSVQRRADTTVDVDNIGLDAVQGRLLAGHQHEFAFTLGDANGIQSLESIRLALLGEVNTSACFIHYEPRFGEMTYDEFCFAERPVVDVQQRPLLTTYDLTFSFRLDWNKTASLNGTVGVPGLSVIDEGQDVGLGLYRLSSLAWTASDDVELRWIDITDLQSPHGQTDGTTHWFHRNDPVQHRIGLYHNNTAVLAEGFPNSGHFMWTLSDSERLETGRVNLSTTGVMNFTVAMNENILYDDEGLFSITPDGFPGHDLNGLSYDVVVDDVAPKLVIAPGMLENFASNELNDVAITVSINDDTDMPPGPLEMHTLFYRLGQPVEGSQQTIALPLNATLNDFTVYSGTVDFLPEGVTLTRSDVLLVWFNATDRSGRMLTGYGTASAPLNVGLTWFAFEPVLTDLSATPFRPVVGENVSVYARVANDGLLAGEFTVVLRDDEGREMNNATAFLNTGEWINFVWNIEAWKEGRLGLTVEIVDFTPQVPVPLADIQPNESDNPSGGMATLSLSVLSLLVAGMVLFVVRNQRAQREEVYHLERIRRIVAHRRPPPKPVELVDILQEE